MKRYIDFLGMTFECECIGCLDKTGRVGWRTIWENEGWRIHQDFAVPMQGLLVLEPKRHIKTNGGLNENERNQFARLFFEIPEAIKEAIGCEAVAAVLEEASSHWHMWFMPQSGEERLEKFPKLFEEARDKFANGLMTLERLDQVNKKIGKMLREKI